MLNALRLRAFTEYALLLLACSCAVSQRPAPRASDYKLHSSDAATRVRAVGNYAAAAQHHAVDDLLFAFADPEASVRLAALHGLCPLFDPRIEQSVRKLVTDADLEVQHAAIFCLGSFKDPSTAKILARALHSDNPGIRRAAVTALLGLPKSAGATFALPALHDPDPEVRFEALRQLRGQSPSRPDVRDAVASLLDDPSPRVSLAAAMTLGLLHDPRAVEPILAHLIEESSNDGPVDWVLGTLAPASVPPLIVKARDPDPKVRALIAEALGLTNDPRALAPLVLLTRDQVSSVRNAAVTGIARLRVAGATAALLEAMPGAEGPQRQFAVEALMDRQNEPGVLDALLTATHEGPHYVRAAAISVLSKNTDPSVRSIVHDALEHSLTDLDQITAENARRELLHRGDFDPAPLLDQLNSSSAYVRKHAIILLDTANDDHKHAAPPADARTILALVDRLNDTDEYNRYLAAQVLADLNTPIPGEADALVRAIQDTEAGNHGPAIVALVKLGDPRAAELAITVRKDPDPRVRGWAMTALAGLDTPQAKALISESAHDDGDKYVRSIALQYLPHPARKPTPTVEQMLTDLRSEDYIVRECAASLLAKSLDPRGAAALQQSLRHKDLGVVAAAAAFFVPRATKENVSTLIAALTEYGDLQAVQVYINSPLVALREAAERWASLRGYIVVPGDDGRSHVQEMVS